MLLVCIGSYRSSVLRLLILVTYHPDTLYSLGSDKTVRGYFSKLKGVQEQKFWETLV